MSELLQKRAPVPEHVDALRSRGAALARVPATERRVELTPVVVFQLSGESYGLDARHVLQVIVLRDMTPLPGAQAPLFGVTHWRGDVLTILDLRAPLGVRQRGVTDLSRVVVVEGKAGPFGILADAARDFIEIDMNALRPLPSEEAGARRLIRGITDDALLVVDAENLLSNYGRVARAAGTG